MHFDDSVAAQLPRYSDLLVLPLLKQSKIKVCYDGELSIEMTCFILMAW